MVNSGSLNQSARGWIAGLLRSWEPEAQAGLAGAPWPHWCDQNGVPPAVHVAAARGSTEDDAVAAAYANQSLWWPRLGKVEGAAELPGGAVARSTGGGWRPLLPAANRSVITWPDDTFMCTAALSHVGPVLGGAAGLEMLEEAAQRLISVFRSGQRDPVDGLLWRGFDTASGAHSCCKWGDGNGWMIMAMADARKGRLALNATTPRSFVLTNSFRALAEAWLAAQRPSGLWAQLMDDHSTYECSSVTGLGLYALATGARLGILQGSNFTTAVAPGWQGLAAKVQPDGSVVGLSQGFGILANRADYLARANSSLLWGYGATSRRARSGAPCLFALCIRE